MKSLLIFVLSGGRKMEREKVIKLAFRKACEFLRNHPPEDTCDHVELVQLVYDGKSDPQGCRWAAYFLQQAIDELKENENKVRDSVDKCDH
jgi:hypothetical protein